MKTDYEITLFLVQPHCNELSENVNMEELRVFSGGRCGFITVPAVPNSL